LYSLVSWSQFEQQTDRILSWVEEEGEKDLNTSLDTLEYGLRSARKAGDLQSEVRLLLSLSQFVLVKLNNVARCSEYLEEIKTIADSQKDNPWILSRYYNGRGVMYYYEATDKEKAFAEFKRSQEITAKYGLKEDPKLLNNYALAFLSEQNSGKALELFNRCRDIAVKEKSAANTRFLVTNASNIGICYIYLGKADSAEYFFQESFRLATLTKGLADDFYSKVYLGVFYEENGEFQKGLDVLNEAEKIMDHSTSLGAKILLYQAYTGIFKALNNFKKSLEYSEISTIYEDSLRQLKLSEQAFAMDYKLELDKVKAQQKIQKLETSVKEKEFTSRITLLSLILVLLLAIGSFIVYRLNKQKELSRIKAANEFLEKERIRQQSEIDLLRKEEELIHANVELNVQKNELSGLKNRLQTHLDKSYDPEFDDLKHFLKQAQKTEKKAEQLKYLDHVLSYSNSAFYSRLKQLHPTMTEDEMRLATLIRLNLSSEELIQVFNISMNSLMTKRYRMRKKLDISKEVGLEEYIMSL
jgi:DNA-binding CsgD family transcriptional regulator